MSAEMLKGEFVEVGGRMLIRLEMDERLAEEFPGATMYLIGRSQVIVHRDAIIIRGVKTPPVEDVRAANELFGAGRKEWRMKGRGR